MRLITFAIYLGIGALCHAVFVSPHFDWTSAWTFGWLFGWPIMFFITFWTMVVGVAVAIGIVAALWMWLEGFTEWREKRRKPASRR